MTETYLAQSPVTDPGAYASWVAELPKDVSALRDASSELVFHYRGGGNYAEPRPASERPVGCCRDFTALFVSFARAHGIPARTRVEFAGYFMPGWWLDHVDSEIWDTVDPKLVGSWLGNEPLRIPEELTSYSPTSGPHLVTLRPGLAT